MDFVKLTGSLSTFQFDCPVPDMSRIPEEEDVGGGPLRPDCCCCCPCPFSARKISSFSVSFLCEFVFATFPFAVERKTNPRFVVIGVFDIVELVLSRFRNPVSAFAVLFRFGLYFLLSILLDEEEENGVVAAGEFPSPVVNKMDLDLSPDAFR